MRSWVAVGLGGLIAASPLTVEPSEAKPARLCTTVEGTYAIHATNDLLHIDHSHHLLVVVSDNLDKALEKRGWEDTVDKGRFTLCGPYRASPLQWAVRDRIDLLSVKAIRFAPR